MSRRVLSLLLLAVAAGLYLGVARPARSDAGAMADAYRRARAARRDAQRELDRAQQLAAVARPSSEPAPGSGALVALRARMLRAARDAGVADVRLRVQPARPPAAAGLQLAASGPLASMTRLASELSGPGRGLALERVRFAAAPEGAALEIDATVFGGAP